MLETGTYGSVGGEGGNILAYPANFHAKLASIKAAAIGARLVLLALVVSILKLRARSSGTLSVR